MTSYSRLITTLLILTFSQNIVKAQYLSAKSQDLKGSVKSVTLTLSGGSFKTTFTQDYDRAGRFIYGHNGTPETVSTKGMFMETKYDSERRLIERKRLVNGQPNRIETYKHSGSNVLVSAMNVRDSTVTNSTETLDRKSRTIKSVSDNLIRTVKFNKKGLKTEITMSSPSPGYSCTTSAVYKIISKDKRGNWTELEQTTTEDCNGAKRTTEGKRYRTITYW